jgi:hypothetical protein
MNILPIELINEIVIYASEEDPTIAIAFNKYLLDITKKQIYNRINARKLNSSSYIIPRIILPYLSLKNRAYVSKHITLNSDFIRTNHQYLNWAYLALYQNLSEDIILEFHTLYFDAACWYIISSNPIYEKVTTQFADKLDYEQIIGYQTIPSSYLLYELKEFHDCDLCDRCKSPRITTYGYVFYDKCPLCKLENYFLLPRIYIKSDDSEYNNH